MSDGIVYSSSASNVLDTWERYKAHAEVVQARRREMRARFDRDLYVVNSSLGHTTRVVGFAVREGEKLGDVLGEGGELRIAKTGHLAGVAAPNVRRKAGKELQAELAALTREGPDLPGMPTFAFIGARVVAPAIHEHDGAVWVYWSGEVEPVDVAFWRRRLLSEYHQSREAMENVA